MARTIQPDSRSSPRFAGVATFCRYPLISHVAPDQHPVDWAIYGIPFDGGVTFRPGARFGPRAIRDASQYVKPHHLEHDVTITNVLSLADGGDAPVAPYSCAETARLACDYALKLGDPRHTRLFAVGGDHSIALANIRATWQRQGKPKGGLALLHFDSHVDTVDVIWDETYNHATVFRRAIEEGLIDPKRMISIGIKGPLTLRADLDFNRQVGATLVTHSDWRRNGPETLTRFVKVLSGAPAYLSFDIDVVDPAFAPGTGTPCPGGFTAAEALDMLRLLSGGGGGGGGAGVDIVGADVVEVLPDRDPTGITALLAAHVIFEILSLDAVRRAGPGPGRGGSKAPA